MTEIPGRFSPTYVVDRRTVSTVATSSATTGVLAFLPRTETVDSTFNTPTNVIDEIGTNFHVGEYDDLPESKLTLSCYDAGVTVLSLITGKNAPTGQTTTYGFNDINTAVVDVVRQFADPNGNVFASLYQGDMVIDEFGFSLKNKAVAMENYGLAGFNLIKFRGFIQTKAYVCSGATTSINLSTVFGANEAPAPLPVPTGSQPASYWIQRGSLNFLKVERWRAGAGWTRFPEVTTAPTTGYCQYTTGTKTLAFATGDLVNGDVVYVTYCTYATNLKVNPLSTPTGVVATPSTTGGTLAAGTTGNYRISALDANGETLASAEVANITTTGATSSVALTWTAVPNAISYNVYGRTAAAELKLANVTTNSYTDTGAATPSGALPASNTTGAPYTAIYQNTPDTSDPVAVPTRLTPFTISGNNIPRGQTLDVKMALKRERAEGIGDVDGMWGPSASPEVSINFEVKKTDFGLSAILETGSPTGSDTGGAGSAAGDYFDPNWMTRSQLSNSVALSAKVYDPRNSATVLKTYTLPAIVLNNDNDNATVKNATTVKYTGTDRTGNLTVSVTR